MDSTDSDSPQGQPFELVNDPVKIHKLLERLQQAHALIAVRLSGIGGSFNSMVLEVDAHRNWLILDELHPQEGHKKLIEMRKLQFFGDFDGVDLRFDGDVIEHGTQSNIHFYKLKFPETIKYYQRRSTYRVRVLRTSAIPVSFVAKDSATAQGELHNISAGGLAVKFLSFVPASIARGEIVPECELAFPNGEKIVCPVEIRHVVSGRNNNQAVVGARFIGLSKIQQRMLSRFIASIEREIRRKST